MLTLLIGFNANAGLLTVDLSTDNVSVGDSVSVTISASDFDDTDLFWFDFNFDNSVMAYDESSLTSGLALVDTNMGLLDGLEVEEYGFGLAFGFSTFDNSLNAAGDFMLASFDLVADSAGFTDLSVSNFFNASAFDDYTIAFSNADSINVSDSVAVSEPSAAFMMLLAGFALVNTRRKTK